MIRHRIVKLPHLLGADHVGFRFIHRRRKLLAARVLPRKPSPIRAADPNGGVTQTITQQPGLPDVTFHTSCFSIHLAVNKFARSRTR
jgi:hypothetical protein